MEYLTLQDIPHRHNDQLHTRKMSPYSHERPLGSMAVANHHMRSSPPIQPGEQNPPDRLPSFSEFLNTTRAHTPPRTPQRLNGSADSSPHAQPHFEEVGWSDGKRRRIDTVADIYAPHPVADMRRMSSMIDPGLASAYVSPRPAPPHHLPGPPAGSVHYHHRPSNSYPPPHISQPSHAPHQQASQHAGYASRSHGAYTIPTAPPASGPTGYAQHPYPAPNGHGGAPNNYCPETAHPVYGYDRPTEAYYGRPSYSGSHASYDATYGELRFQQHVGLDQGAFNRKRRGNLPKEATNVLKEWFQMNRTSPYPTEDQKMELCQRTGLSLNQVSNWFINARRRAPQKEERERQANNSQTNNNMEL